MNVYERRQVGMIPLLFMLLVLPLIAASIHAMVPGGALVVLFVIVTALGSAILRTRVDAQAVRWSFTFGWPAGHIPIAAIERAEITTTNLLEGWGIHWTIWHGWLWNVGGFKAVEIHYDGGKRVTLGTDDPQGLLDALERFRRGAA